MKKNHNNVKGIHPDLSKQKIEWEMKLISHTLSRLLGVFFFFFYSPSLKDWNKNVTEFLLQLL